MKNNAGIWLIRNLRDMFQLTFVWKSNFVVQENAFENVAC